MGASPSQPLKEYTVETSDQKMFRAIEKSNIDDLTSALAGM